MKSRSDLSTITILLSEWYMSSKRDLPWRKTTDPYRIWLSEIILQQTRVEQGKPYFTSILERFPSVRDLAESPTDELLKLWQGLGYYSRARNLHAAAVQIMNDFDGKFPSTYEDLLKLKGVGEYTASAIASFAYHIPKAVVDGNVFRVLSRLFAINTPINTTEGKKLFTALAEDLLDTKHPDTHNQAMMDFGAIQCTPSNPGCRTCPLAKHCNALAAGLVQSLPVKLAGSKKQERHFNYFFLTDGESTWLQQRLDKDIWQRLWEFPLIETENDTPLETLLLREDLKAWTGQQCSIETPVYLKHILSHRIIHARFYTVHIQQQSLVPDRWRKVNINKIDQYAISRLMDLFLEKALPLFK